MKKIIAIVITVIMTAIFTAGCKTTDSGGSGSSSQHVETPKTVADLQQYESFGYQYTDDKYACVYMADGVYYRAEADIPKDVSDALLELSWEDPDHDSKQMELLGPLEIKNLINLSEQLLSQEELDQLAGKTGEELLDDDWEPNGGYEAEKSIVTMEKGPFQYAVTFDSAIEESDDIDLFEIIKPMRVKSAEFLFISNSASDIAVEEESGEEIPEDNSDTPLIGGWNINEEIVTPVLSEEAAKAFELASASYTGIDLEPAALLATQVVSGTNYLYLCKGQKVTEEPVAEWYMTVVYEELDGNAEITSVENLNLLELKTKEESPETGLVGAWMITDPANAITLPEDAWQAFKQATETYDDVTFSPLALLATQIVSGTNYMIFCQGETNTEEPLANLYVVNVYEDLDGNAEVTEKQQLDMLAYVG